MKEHLEINSTYDDLFYESNREEAANNMARRREWSNLTSEGAKWDRVNQSLQVKKATIARAARYMRMDSKEWQDAIEKSFAKTRAQK